MKELTTECGARIEQAVRNYLEKHGLSFVCKNFRTRLGEIDLIMREQETLVFIEVRYRRSDKYGSPIETVTYSKRKKLVKAAKIYLQRQGLLDQKPCRFDIVGVTQNATKFEWIKDAFWERW
jgi:putative endonuclease